MFRSGNPALQKNDAFGPAQTWDDLSTGGHAAADAAQASRGAPEAAAAGKKVMSVQGTVNKTLFMLALCVATSLVGWNLVMAQSGLAFPVMIGGALLGFLVAMVTVFKPQASPITGPIYALLQGVFVGGISGVYAQRFATEESGLATGLILNAVLLTFGITGGLLAAYTTRILRPGRLFYNAVIAGTLGVALFGLVAMVSSFIAPGNALVSVYNPENASLLSIGFSLFVVVLASANLVIDFDVINNGVKNRAPKYMEWYGAFGLMVTLVWLYLEILRLLAKLQSRE